MIMYNPLMGVAAGGAMLLVPRMWAVMAKEPMPLLLIPTRSVEASGWAASFGVLGLILTGLGGAMTTTGPLTEKPYINQIFGAPCLMLGVLLLAAAWWLARTRSEIDLERMRDVLAPVSWVVAAVGLVLAACTAAILRFDVVSSAPVEEPITGRLNGYPIVENGVFAAAYGLAAVGALLFPAAVRGRRWSWGALYWAWTVAGGFFLLFSALNFYTHPGMEINLTTDGPDFGW